MSLRPSTLRNLALAAALPAALLAQHLVPDGLRGQPLATIAPGREALPPIAMLAAVGLPGVEDFVNPLELGHGPLEIDASWAMAAAGSYPSRPDARAFAPPTAPVRPLVLNGHSDFHHLTYFVLRDFIEPLGLRYGVVSFDGHDDASAGGDGRLGAGNWTGVALERLGHLTRVVQVGLAVSPFDDLASWLAPSTLPQGRYDLFPAVSLSLFSRARPDPHTAARALRRDLVAAIRGRPGFQIDLEPFGEHTDLAARLGAPHAYVTVDMNALATAECGDLGWEAGRLTVDAVLAAIAALARERPLLGADLTGYPPARHDVNLHFDPVRCAASYRRLALGLRQALEAAR